MFHSKLVSAIAVLWLSSALSPAIAGSDRQAPEVAPQAQSSGYGGGLIEFMMTGRSPQPPARALPRAPRYMASAATGEAEPPAFSSGPAGYEMPHKAVDPAFVKQEVSFDGQQAAGSIVIDTSNKFLYLVEAPGRALRYGIGVGRPGFLWHGEKTITRKAEWPDWTPPVEMIKRRPDLPSHMDGGIANPLGARAMYLGSTLYRIHGTNEPDTIGTNVSSGCIRLTNDDVTDLFSRVRVGTKVFVM
ncbi:L,D-transpeptidase [Lichenihabitans psoromatis]|uniref:L,D-transpeptidase n=1 Tax=Lichenihabitans psoromatis TaxID=2528642 RepID=UPI001036E55A|nr:L,D-transpeptidase [Lichenihabitans psoromatis]